MASIVDRLPPFALPFVTRSLRGGRARRFVVLSFGLALLTALTCLWIGLGEGRVAHARRVGLGMEEPTQVLEHREFVLVRHSEFDDSSLERREKWAIEKARRTIQEAIAERPTRREHLELQSRAKALAATWAEPESGSASDFSWDDPAQVRRLETIVDRGGVPAIVDYEPVIDLIGALRLLAIVAGGLLTLLFIVVAPLLVALQQATERHENTFHPLTGTGLSARELAIGMACGPLAIVAIFAAPLAALFVFAAIATGSIASLVLFPIVAGTAIGLVFGAQLLGHLAGSRRAPGLIAAALLSLLGLVTAVGLGLGSNLVEDVVRMTAVFPHAGAFALLGDCFGDAWRAVASARHFYPRTTLDDFLLPTLLGTLGAAVLGSLALHALTRHIEGRPTLLEFRHALLGALTCIGMVDVALPMLSEHEPFHQAAGLPALALPLLLLIMARVPAGDVPTKLRRIPLARLLGEFAGWTAVHLVVAAVLDGTIAGFHPIALLGVAWCVLVLVLVAVRTVATPNALLGNIWTAVCLFFLPLAYGPMTVAAIEPGVGSALFELPVLSLLWLAMLVCVPLSLFRLLHERVGGLGAEQAFIPAKTR